MKRSFMGGRTMPVFGPVPSRRLGRSLGINTIPPKVCSYACRYCQLGQALTMTTERRPFYATEDLVDEVARNLKRLKRQEETVDYLAFVPDGEPTLDIGLGETARALKVFSIPLAVITNASLIADRTVREELSLFDWVSLKVDAATEGLWRALDRPHGALAFEAIIDGLGIFSASYGGHLETETMLVAGRNDGDEALEDLASLLASMAPSVCRLSSPTRPPACGDVTCCDEERLAAATAILRGKGLDVRLLNAYEGNDFVRTGDTREALLAILSVHPMREEALSLFLADAKDGTAVLRRALEEKDLLITSWRGATFYVRNLRKAAEERR